MVFKRIIAYLIDIFIVVFASSMLASISYINPQLDSYNKVYNEYLEVNKNYLNELKEKNNENVSSFRADLNEINYRLDRNNLYGATIQIVITLLYFVVFQKYNKGQTLGKKLMKIRIDGDLSLFKYLIRSLVLHSVLTNFIKIALILLVSKENYILASNILYVGALLIEVTIIVMVEVRTDKRGLHDLLAGSRVVSA